MDDQSQPIKLTPKGSYYRPQDSGKPDGAPAGKKDFKKIYDSESDDSQEQASEAVEGKQGDAGEATVQKSHAAPANPFALFGRPAAVPSKAALNGPKASPASLAAQMNKKGIEEATAKKAEETEEIATADETSDRLQAEELSAGAKLAIADEVPKDVPCKVPADAPKVSQEIPKPVTDDAAKLALLQKNRMHELAHDKPHEIIADKPAAKEEPHTQFAREQPDLSYVNPLGAALQQVPAAPVEAKAERVLTAPDLQSLVEQMVKELSVLKQGDKTETSIVLNHPPKFDGVRIMITGYESSPNEFNLKFENLTPEAKLILDQQQNRADLLSNLERKGYNVHIFVTTTYTETVPLATNVDTPQRERGRGEDRGSSGDERKEKERQSA